MGLLGSDSRNQSWYFECRHCGTTVDGHTEVCPSCGSQDIVEYDLV